MKKGVIFVFLFVYLLSSVLGLAGGVSPAYYEVDFEPNLKQEFTFNYFFDTNVEYEVSISGDLADYVKVKEKNIVFGRLFVKVEINLPSDIEVPGVHKIRIGVRGVPKNSNGISLSNDVGALIRVRVPYPGKYAELQLETEYVNVGEDVTYKLTIYSRGSESILANPKVEVSNEEGVIDSFVLDTKLISSTENFVYEGVIETKNYNAGDYNLTAIVEYGGEKPALTTGLFRLGELKVRIINYTKELPLNKLGRYSIKVESLWNNPIKGVYATGNIIGYPGKEFTTPTIGLSPWYITQIEGFLDTNDIKEDVVDMNLTLHYAGNYSDNQIVKLNLVSEINWIVIVVVVAIIIIVLLILGLLITVIYLLKKNKQKNK